jgi:aminobenzoyl-glutamate transport protein
VFFAAQMLAFFNWSNLGTIIAVKGAELLQNQHGMVLIVGVVILSSIVNIFIGSASAKWAILAPIFVPMMMLLGFHPAFTQMIYRVGDSITNPITPMLPYFPLVLGLAQKYDRKMGIGTLIAALLPYSIAIGVCWTIFLLVWFWLGWPVGPGGPIYLNTPVGG